MDVLDTSAVIEIINGTDKGKAILNLIRDRGVGVTSFTVHETLLGIKPKFMSALAELFKSINILPYDSLASVHSADIEKELSSRGEKINIIDVFIAGVCRMYSAKIITLDRDFTRVRDLKVELV